MEDNNPLKMKVTELKAQLGKRGLSQTGLKFDLAQRLQSAMDVEEFGALPLVSSLSSSSPSPCFGPSKASPSPEYSISIADNAAPDTSAAPDEESTGLTPTATEAQESKPHASPRQRSKHDIDMDRPMLVTAPPESSSKVEVQIDTAHEATATNLQAEDTGGQPTSDVTSGDAGNQAMIETGSATCVEPNNERSGECGTEEKQHADNSWATAVEVDTPSSKIKDAVPSKIEGSTVTPLEEGRNYPRGADGCITGKNARGDVENQIALELGEEGIVQKAKLLRKEPELAREYSSGADNIGPLDSETSMAADLPSEGLPLLCDEIDQMKDREQRFGQAHVADDSGDGEVRCGGGSDGGGSVVCLGVPSGVLEPVNASRAVVLPVPPSEDTRTKLMKRKARFGTPRSTTDPLSGAAGVGSGEAPRGEPAKMARRAERLGVPTGACNNVPSATSHTSAPGPVSGSNTTDPSTVEIRTQPLSGGGDSYTFDPLPQRPKRFRAQATPSETGGTPAQPKPRAGDGEGGPTLVISATTSSQCMVVPQENGSVSPRDSNRPTLQAEKLRQRKVRFLPVAASQNGDVEPPQRDNIPFPPTRISTEATSSLPPCAVSSCLFERCGVTSGSLPMKRHAILPRSKCSSDADRKAAEQAAKMRERQKRFAEDLPRVINNIEAAK